MRSEAQRLVYLAVMTALSVVLTRVAGFRVAIGGIEGIRIGLGPLPLIMSGVLWGPAAGFFVGAVADIVGYVISPMGAYLPQITLTTALAGALPALVLKLTGYSERPGIGKLAGAIFVGQLITSLILVPYFLYTLVGMLWRPLLFLDSWRFSFMFHLYFLDSLPCESNPVFTRLAKERQG